MLASVQKVAKRKCPDHFIRKVTVTLKRIHMPIGGAIGEDLHQGISLAVNLALKGLLDRVTRCHDSLLIVERLSGNVDGGLELGDHLSKTNGITGQPGVSTLGTTGCSLPNKSRGCHLSSGHSIDLVVEENYGDILTAIRGMD
jgi:hypothetical protein